MIQNITTFYSREFESLTRAASSVSFLLDRKKQGQIKLQQRNNIPVPPMAIYFVLKTDFLVSFITKSRKTLLPASTGKSSTKQHTNQHKDVIFKRGNT